MSFYPSIIFLDSIVWPTTCVTYSSGGLLDLEFPSTNLYKLEDSVPLPDFISDRASGHVLGAPDSHFQYHFLAQITLQRVLSRVYTYIYGRGMG